MNGKWHTPKEYTHIIDPLNGEKFLEVPDTQAEADLKLFSDSLKKCPKSGLHNPLKNPERYQMFGEVSWKIAETLRKPEVENFFTDLMQRYASLTPESFLRATIRLEENSSLPESVSRIGLAMLQECSYAVSFRLVTITVSRLLATGSPSVLACILLLSTSRLRSAPCTPGED